MLLNFTRCFLIIWLNSGSYSFSNESLVPGIEEIQIVYNKYNQIFQNHIKVPKNLTGNHYESSEQYSEIGKFKLINLHIKIKHDFSDYENSLIAVKKNLEKLKKCLIESDTVILTLGLIEAWIRKSPLVE